ncbi:MAG: pyridoxal-phosphate dependent enzyme [Treponema sp.]|jgi:threonine synthase|nr:pyridoxal-phosphate dependent enzyme [Treponema sp.]
MQFRSTRSQNLLSFKDAVLRCLPSDGGLYVPAAVTDMRQFFFYMDGETSFHQLAATVTPSLFQGELNPFSASLVAESAFNFEPELRQLDERFSVLNLYNGPTGVFKDFGIAFLAAVMEEMLKNNGPAMVISASRGDTGVSNAHAFHRRQGITSVILYPSGPIRGLNPDMFVPNGGNIIPIQVKGTFDDCQRLITAAIYDRSFADRYGVTSANAINVGRLLPQAFYYLYGFIQIKKQLCGDLIFSVPSGNFGNLIAGLYAWKFGMPVNGFIAAMNANNAFRGFAEENEKSAAGGLRSRGPGSFSEEGLNSRKLITTNSPALDVSCPSNYERLLAFYEEAPAVMRYMVHPVSVNDAETLTAMNQAWKRYGQLLDSHSAVAFAAAERMAADKNFNGHIVVLATGHPAIQADLVAGNTGQMPEIPEKISLLRKETEPLAIIPDQLDALQAAIASCF